MAARSASTRGLTFNIRVEPRRRDLIDRAAAAVGKSRSEFVLETACREAEAVLLDRRFFSLDETTLQDFLSRLDNPQPTEKLVRLLKSEAPWEA